MGDAFRSGGWGMYPTVIAGLVLVGAAISYAVRPDARGRLGVRALAMLTFLVACLGFVSGVIRSCTAAADPETGRFVIVGIGESLTNIGLGLVMLVAAGIATAIGTYRTEPRTGGAELHGL